MILLLCILCNVVLAIIFKAFGQYKVDNLNAIVVNYVVCVAFASIILGESAIPMDLLEKSWWPYSLALSLLFITGFNILGLSFQKSGVALTAIIQKMSLIISAAVAIAVYGEPCGILKAAGMFLALIAIVLVNLPSNDSEKLNWRDPVIIYPLITFGMSGVIEVILYYVEVEGIVGADGAQFTASSFGQAAVFGVFFSIYQWFKDGVRFTYKEILGGIALGVPNYLSIYLLVYLLSQGWQGSVLFPANSIGILVLMALVGFVLYKEKINTNRLLGIGAGVLAIVLISWPLSK